MGGSSLLVALFTTSAMLRLGLMNAGAVNNIMFVCAYPLPLVAQINPAVGRTGLCFGVYPGSLLRMVLGNANCQFLFTACFWKTFCAGLAEGYFLLLCLGAC